MYQKQIYQGSKSLCEVGSQNKNRLPARFHDDSLYFAFMLAWLFFNVNNVYVKILLQTQLMQDFD